MFVYDCRYLFLQAFLRGIMANWLVNIAIWQAMASSSLPGKVGIYVHPCTGRSPAGLKLKSLLQFSVCCERTVAFFLLFRARALRVASPAGERHSTGNPKLCTDLLSQCMHPETVLAWCAGDRRRPAHFDLRGHGPGALSRQHVPHPHGHGARRARHPPPVPGLQSLNSQFEADRNLFLQSTFVISSARLSSASNSWCDSPS